MNVLEKSSVVQADDENGGDAKKISGEQDSWTDQYPIYFLHSGCRIRKDKGYEKQYDMNCRAFHNDFNAESGMGYFHAANCGGNTNEGQKTACDAGGELVEWDGKPGIWHGV